MKKLLLSALTALCLLTAQFMAQAPASDGPKRTPRALKIKVPGEVERVIWSARPDEGFTYTVQIDRDSYRDGQASSARAVPQVWLLRGDGTVVPPRGEPHPVTAGSMGWLTDSLMYSFQKTRALDVVAIAISVDGQFFVEPLPTHAHRASELFDPPRVPRPDL